MVMEGSPVTLATIKEAADKIKPFVHVTPVLTSDFFDDLSGRSLLELSLHGLPIRREVVY